MRPYVRILLIALLPTLLFASLALGAGITITPQGNGSFVINGTGLKNVGGIDLTVTYDSVLGSPSVSQAALASGATMAANTNNNGTIRIAILNVTGINGSGPLVTLTFGSHSGSGHISVTPSMIDVSSASIPAGAPASAADYQTTSGTETASTGTPVSGGAPASGPSSNAGSTGGSGATAPSSGTSSGTSTGTVVLGTVTMPGASASEARPAESSATRVPPAQDTTAQTKPAEQQAAPEKPAETPENEEAKQVIYSSALDRFRAYTEERTPARMIALLMEAIKSSPLIHQDPLIGVSDGKTPLRITVELPQKAGTSPNFALSGAKLVSVKRDEETGKWILEATPSANTLKATITILNGKSLIELPLMVVPPLKKVSTAEADFAAFLKDSGAKAPRYDLNGDGKHDYQDDLIYTCHYLLNKEKQTKPER